MTDESLSPLGNRSASMALRFPWARRQNVPVFDVEGDARVARVVQILGVAIVLAIVPAVIHNLAVGGLVSATVLALDQGFVLFCLWVNHRGAQRVAARLIGISSIALVAALQAVSRKGAHDVAVLIYPAVIVLSGALLDRRWFVLTTLLAMFAMAGQYALEFGGVLGYPLTPFLEWRQLADAEVIVLVTALAVELLVRSLRESMGRLERALQSLRESETLYRTLFESASEAFVVFEIESGTVVDFNPRASEMFGYSREAMRGLSLEALIVDSTENRRADALSRIGSAARGQTQVFEWQARSQNGRAFWVEIHMRSVVIAGIQRVMVSMRNIDERRRAAIERQRLEEQLHQAQKMESIGRLAGGVAHDFNNLLTCIGGNAELALMGLDPQREVTQNLQEIKGAVERASDLTRRLLAFSRKQPIEPRPLELADLFESAHRMLARLLGEHVQLVLEVAPDTRPILADPSQIEQILMNLVVNARDAMPEGGTIKLEVGNLVSASEGSDVPKGQYVRIAVIDSGIGIPEQHLPNIFEPFYTTKPAGKGTGLGLSMVLGAVQQNGGFIRVESSPGNGSTFEILLPVLEAEVRPSVKPASHSTPGDRERVLLVEDDVSVRQTTAQLLKRLGYRVSACADAEEAIDCVEQQRQEFELLITDVILPGIDGKALAERLRSSRPSMKVLYCSGYTAEVIAHRGVLDEGIAFIAKPFGRETLGRKVRAVLCAERALVEQPGG